jgi:hypothetical protein
VCASVCVCVCECAVSFESSVDRTNIMETFRYGNSD